MDVKTKGITMPDGNTHIFIPPSPTENRRGGIKAKKRTTENVEVAVGEDDKLYIPSASDVSEAKVFSHNTSPDAHSDIRLLLQEFSNRLNALADSDDTTLDQMSEVVAFIKNNKNLIDAITTSKVSITDIVDNLTTNVSNKPLSAAQGIVLKTLIDESGLPKVTESDNNKILQVVNGVWSLVEVVNGNEVTF